MFGEQSHVDTSYISLRTQSFWALTKTLISSMISIKSKQRNAVAQIKQIRRVNGNICQHTWSIYWIEHGQHLLFETLFAVIDNDIVLQECLGVTLDFDFCTKWDSQLSLLETFIATINGRTPLPAQISASNFHDLVHRVISNFSVRFEPNLKSHLSAGWFDNVYFRDWANTDITQEIQEFQKDI